jgi:hypothetical protein
MAAVIRNYQAGIPSSQLTADYDLGKSSAIKDLA